MSRFEITKESSKRKNNDKKDAKDRSNSLKKLGKLVNSDEEEAEVKSLQGDRTETTTTKRRLSQSTASDEHQGTSSSGSEETRSNEQDLLPVEPEALSKKDKRKRRKLEKQKSTIDEPTGSTIENSQPKSSKIESIFTTNTRTKYGVWVGNMLFSTTPQELHGFLKDCGAITRIHMPTGKKQFENNKGFAYVDFEAEQGCENAVEKSERMLGGRKLLIKKATDYSGRPTPTVQVQTSADPNGQSSKLQISTLSKTARKILEKQKQAPAPCLYLGNLGFETTEEKIKGMFEANHIKQDAWKSKTLKASEGSDEKSTASKSSPGGVGIRKVRMGTFEDTGKCKGFAFVDFSSVQQATNALLNPKNYALDGRRLTVEYASPDAVRRGGGSLKSIQSNPRSQTEGESTNSRPFKPRPKYENRTESVSKRSREELDEKETNESNLELTTTVEKRKIKKEFQGRQKPGAALANARRAPIGIIKNPQVIGKKIVFD